MRRTGLALLALLLAAPAVHATTIDPLLWQELAELSDFIGVVECDIAGGIVARYKVIETWKGEEKPGAQIAIRTAVNYWEPQYPLALVGDRVVVTAYKNRAPDTMASTTMGGPVPLWWRRIPWDYTLPLFQGMYAAGTKETKMLKKDIATHLALDAEKRELALIKALSERYLETQKRVAGRVAAAKAISEALQALMTGWKAANEETQWGYHSIFAKSGAVTRAWVRAKDKLAFREPEDRERLLEGYDSAEKRNELREATATESPAAVPAETIAAWKASFAKGEEDPGFYQALEELTRREPAIVATWLAAWVNPAKSWTDTDRGYGLASWFAVNCLGDRKVHLTTLLSAKDPYVRATGAVYLALEDEATGLPALREAAKIPGDPGSWAALALARRGDRAALLRAIDVLRGEADAGGMAAVPKRNLRKRVAELLSNTAAAKGLSAPIRPDDEDAYTAAKKWIEAHPDLAPVDPWMPTLHLQKID